MDWQSVKIFISSTFNDMHGERDYLVKNVFPELRDWCEKRKIHLVDVDLRWGVTSEDTKNLKTVEVCLKNIDESRPFFVCFLGQRRGWVPPNISEDTEKIYPQLKERMGDKSITEIEIEYASLYPMYREIFEDNEDKKIQYESSKCALFFFRDDDYLNKLSSKQKNIYTNEGERYNSDGDYYFKDLAPDERVIHADKKLFEFKESIISKYKEKSFKIHRYKGIWDKEHFVPGLNHLGNVSKGGFKDFQIENEPLKEYVLGILKEKILNKFPSHKDIEETTELKKELGQQDLFREINTQGFFKREEIFQKLNDFLDDDNGLCLLTAEEGFGKTMLLANFSNSLKEKALENGNDLNIFTRFSEVSDKSGDQYSIWRSILEEAEISLPKGKDGLDDWIPNLEKLKSKENIERVLNNLSKNGETIIIIDGVNQLPDGLEMIKWLPKDLPDNLKIILSFKEDEESQKLIDDLDENFNHLKIKKLEFDEKKSIINEYLNQFLKALDDERINTICKAEGSDNPLFLKILLNELRVFGQHEELERQIANFPSNPQKAFQKVLDRLENEVTYTKIDSKEIIKLIFGFLANTRYGLSEEELINSINIYQKENNKKEFSEDDLKDVIRLSLRQVKPFMKRLGGKHGFFYESFKSAAKDKYKEWQIEFHQALANYFLEKADPQTNFSFKGEDIRPFDELAYHLKKSNNTILLKKILTSFLWIKNKIILSNKSDLANKEDLGNKTSLSDIFKTINDYNYIDLEIEDNYSLKLIKGALINSSHILKENINELPTQLFGRLKCHIENPEIKEFLIEIDEFTNYPWLKPQHHMQSPENALKATLKEHTKAVKSVCFSNDGKYIASASEDNTILVWDWENTKIIKRLKGHTKYVRSVDFSPNNKYIVSGSDDKTICIWDWENENVEKKLKKHNGSVYSVCFSPDGKYVASGSADKFVRIFNWENEKEERSLKMHKGSVYSVCFSPDGKYVASGSADKNIFIWEWEKRWIKQIKKLDKHTSDVSSVCFSPDGKYIVSGSWDNTVRVWDWENKREIRNLKGHTDYVDSVSFSPYSTDGKYIASGSGDNTVRVWDWENEREIRNLKGHTDYVDAVCFSPECTGSKYIASGSGDETIRVWSWENASETEELEVHTKPLRSVCFSHNNEYIASGSEDATVCLWDLENTGKFNSLEGHNAYVTSVDFSPDGKYITSGSVDNTVCIWDLENLGEFKSLEGHRNEVWGVCFFPDGNCVASGSWDKSVRVWDLENLGEFVSLDGHSGYVTSVAFSSDGKYLVSGSTDKSVRVWDLENLGEFVSLDGHSGYVWCVCFSHEGNYVASGSSDETVRLWDWKNIKEIQNPIILLNTEEDIFSCSISNNNHQLVAGGKSGQVLIYSIENLPAE